MMPRGSYRVFEAGQVARAYDDMAARLNDQLPDGEILLLPVMNGGMFPACELARRIRRPMRFDYVHASRYQGKMSGAEVEWLRWPALPGGEQTVLLIDDIFDEGYTLAAISDRLPNSYRVISAALVLKQHDRGLARDWVDVHGLVVPDVYVFGCGMDFQENYRELPEIWAVSADD